MSWYEMQTLVALKSAANPLRGRPPGMWGAQDVLCSRSSRVRLALTVTLARLRLANVDVVDAARVCLRRDAEVVSPPVCEAPGRWEIWFGEVSAV